MFDNNVELLKKITLGEDSQIEYKAIYFKGDKISDPSRDDLADELAAFANANNGVIVLGIDDKTKNVDGIPLNKLDIAELFVREICNDSIKPSLYVRITKMTLPDNTGQEKAIIKIDIPRSLFVHESPHGYFYRLGSSKRKMPPEILSRLFQQRSQARLLWFEEQAVPNTSTADLSPELWERFTTRSTEPHETILLKRNLLAKEEDGTVRASVAGILLCSKTPDKYMPNTYIEAVRYRGTQQDSNYQMDALQIKGPLDEQIKLAMMFLRRNLVRSATKVPQRDEKVQFSERAVFEAIVNAVAHRDYSIATSKIRFFIFDDRLEIYSPGALPNTVTIESIQLRQATRNELITSLLAECPIAESSGNIGRSYYMEKRGDGVPIIMNESVNNSGIKPIYRLIDDSELLLTIYANSTLGK
jgi:predicted HTH transcriptional regulator